MFREEAYVQQKKRLLRPDSDVGILTCAETAETALKTWFDGLKAIPQAVEEILVKEKGRAITQAEKEDWVKEHTKGISKEAEENWVKEHRKEKRGAWYKCR
jgi:hypothetical protein